MVVKQHTEVVAILTIIAAIGGVIVTVTGDPAWGFIIQLLVILFAVIGLLVATSPRVGGRIISLIALIIAVLGLGLSVLSMLGMLGF